MNDNGKKLLDKISELDPKLITDAEKKPRRKSRMFIGITSGMATAAAVALIAVAANSISTKNPPIIDTSDPVSSSDTTISDPIDSGNSSEPIQDPPVTEEPAKDPPKLDFSKYKDLPKISGENYNLGAMGGGTIYDMYSWQLGFSSPWKGAELETMPVYISSSTEIPDLDKMYARVKEMAAALGIPEDRLTITDTYEDMTSSIEQQRKLGKEVGASDEEIEEVIDRMIRNVMSMVYVEAQTDEIRIHLDTSYTAWIIFDEPVKLPKDYNFTHSATAEERDAALSYLADKYEKLMGYGNPAMGRSYYFLYDADGDLTEQIVNCWINSTEFQIDENTGLLESIGIVSDGALEKLADYPILTPEQAEAILKSNKYDDRDRMPADAKILKTELMYKNLIGYTAVMPYYQFYVEVDEKPNGDCDLVCEVYTIAAVPEEFIDIKTADYGVRA